MSEEKVMIPLTKGKKNAVIIGCVCLMFSVTVFGVVFLSFRDRYWQKCMHHSIILC